MSMLATPALYAASHAGMTNDSQAPVPVVAHSSGTGGATASPCELAPCKLCAPNGQACAECWPSYALRNGFCLRKWADEAVQ